MLFGNLCHSHRYGFKDKQVEQFMKKIHELQNDFMLIGLLDFFPILNYIVPKPLINIILGINKFDRATQEFQDLVKFLIISSFVSNLIIGKTRKCIKFHFKHYKNIHDRICPCME
ncbi:hypothetical protein Avbf_08363 [Armadillidium vulgare]|nr:hypothetical protein Avbf_08363 [Armadillidium vulgare]